MTVASELDRIEKAKRDIRTAIENQGELVPAEETIDKYAAHINNIGGLGRSGNPNAIAKITGASVGDFLKVSSVDSAGTPTSVEVITSDQLTQEIKSKSGV